jgi:pimeloyl-ACP methyl ester carboxylesterase
MNWRVSLAEGASLRCRFVGIALIILAYAIVSGCQEVSIKKLGRRASVVPTHKLEGISNRGEPLFGSFQARREVKDLALRHDLDSLTHAARIMQAADDHERPPSASDLARARAIYNAALERFLRETAGRRMRLDETWREDLASRGIRISVQQGEALWTSDRFDDFLFARDYKVGGLEHQYRAEGLGVPLIGERQFRLDEFTERTGQDKFLMPRQVYPVTALLRVVPPEPDRAGDPTEFRLELHDPLLTRSVAFEGRGEPLAADLTTPIAYHFARSPLPILQEIGLLDPQWLEKVQGLYMLHPYEPGKIPVLLIHGLRSSPVAWMKVVNELRGDPALRERYQFWLFMYPTGTPFPASAAHLRRALDELRQVVDPVHADSALDQMVVVGHSMGGLISKMMVLESGNAVWKLVANRPFEDLRATNEHRDLLHQVFFFGPHPSIKRLIFIATPHRGSELGDQFIGQLAKRLIRLPGSLRSTYRVLLAQNSDDFFTPQIRAGLPTSIDELRRDNSLLATLSHLPVGPGVEYHSIIGKQEDGIRLESSSDGVVPYDSAHVDGAASELVVRGDHGCQDSPETIREIRRILSVHLIKCAAAAPSAGTGGRHEPVPIAISPLQP